MRTNYVGHDDMYKKNKASGQAGWDPAEISEAVIQQFKELFQHGAIPKNCRLLELGCGAGNLSVGFATMGYQVTGVDIAPSAIEWAKERAEQENIAVDFLVDNVVSLSKIEARDFELIVDSHCLHCIIGEDRKKFYAKVKDHLKANGVFVVNTMCRNAKSTEIQGFQPETGLTVHGDLATRFIGRREEIEKEVKDAGFTIVESRLILDEDGVADDLLLILHNAA